MNLIDYMQFGTDLEARYQKKSFKAGGPGSGPRPGSGSGPGGKAWKYPNEDPDSTHYSDPSDPDSTATKTKFGEGTKERDLSGYSE